MAIEHWLRQGRTALVKSLTASRIVVIYYGVWMNDTCMFKDLGKRLIFLTGPLKQFLFHCKYKQWSIWPCVLERDETRLQKSSWHRLKSVFYPTSEEEYLHRNYTVPNTGKNSLYCSVNFNCVLLERGSVYEHGTNPWTLLKVQVRHILYMTLGYPLGISEHTIFHI